MVLGAFKVQVTGGKSTRENRRSQRLRAATVMERRVMGVISSNVLPGAAIPPQILDYPYLAPWTGHFTCYIHRTDHLLTTRLPG